MANKECEHRYTHARQAAVAGMTSFFSARNCQIMDPDNAERILQVPSDSFAAISTFVEMSRGCGRGFRFLGQGFVSVLRMQNALVATELGVNSSDGDSAAWGAYRNAKKNTVREDRATGA